MRPVRFPEECGLFVDFGGDDAPEHHQRIGDQRFEFVLARIDRDRSDERAAFADVLHDRLVVGDAAREDDGLNAAREGRGHGSDLFHDVVAHGVENLFGPLVALREVRLPAGVKALGCLAFFACQALSFVSCDGVEEVGVQALSGCPSLESVQLPEAVRIYNAAFMASGLTSLSLPETTRLGYSAFQHCDALTELRLTAAGNITLEMDSGATPFSPNFAKVCDLTLNADKHYSTGTAAPKAASADQWATNYYGDPLTWKSIAFE